MSGPARVDEPSDDFEPRSLDLGALLQQPHAFHGTAFTVRGTARRVTRVEIEDDEFRERFGIDHYYQLDVFVPLEGQVIQFTSPDSSVERPIFENSYPVTVCTVRLPATLSVGEDQRFQVASDAFFFKLWAYRSRYVTSFDEDQLQLSPLLVGFQPRWIPPPASNSALPLLMGLAFLAVLAGIWTILWRLNRADVRAAAVRRRKRQ